MGAEMGIRDRVRVENFLLSWPPVSVRDDKRGKSQNDKRGKSQVVVTKLNPDDVCQSHVGSCVFTGSSS